MAQEPRDQVTSVALSKSDRAAIERVAAQHDMTTSEFLRASALMMCALNFNPHALLMLVRGAKKAVTRTESELERVARIAMGR
jgi:hypothetical protein